MRVDGEEKVIYSFEQLVVHSTGIVCVPFLFSLSDVVMFEHYLGNSFHFSDIMKPVGFVENNVSLVFNL